MPQETLNLVKIGPPFQKVGRKTVPKRMHRGVFLDPGFLKDLSERPVRLQILWGESPQTSIARFGRLVYPGHDEVTNHEMLGGKSHSCTAKGWGRSDQGGEQTWGSEHKGMTAAPRIDNP